ncbi:DUF928 domain-containing protein [Dapis sp. BLCC M229]|uniref:DUF928 domain-containing protein n=1 Tax=Dapis sp. BLCC M229 TaxID=3400188 RepID=UPI003CED1B63
MSLKNLGIYVLNTSLPTKFQSLEVLPLLDFSHSHVLLILILQTVSKPEKSLYNKLVGVTPLTLPTVYASQGIWYDALESMVQLRRLNPNNPKLIDDWQKLFNSANSQGKEELIPAPILDCCQRED